MPRRGANLSDAAAERQRESIARWQAENTDKICIRVRKGRREAYRALSEITGISVSRLITDHLDALCEEHGIT